MFCSVQFMEKFDEMKLLSSAHKNDSTNKSSSETSTPSPRSNNTLSLQVWSRFVHRVCGCIAEQDTQCYSGTNPSGNVGLGWGWGLTLGLGLVYFISNAALIGFLQHSHLCSSLMLSLSNQLLSKAIRLQLPCFWSSCRHLYCAFTDCLQSIAEDIPIQKFNAELVLLSVLQYYCLQQTCLPFWPWMLLLLRFCDSVAIW